MSRFAQYAIHRAFGRISPSSASRIVNAAHGGADYVFLCGANQSPGVVSARREALLEFGRLHLASTHQFFLAEKVFKALTDSGHRQNLLDIESDLTRFADHVVIVLESESAFAELGSFSHTQTLRRKIIVINDKKFESEPSFINLGPIQAIVESTDPAHILKYTMRKDGVRKVDGIGDIFLGLNQVLSEKVSRHRASHDISSLNPLTEFNKYSMWFVHDLIQLMSPVSRKELVEALKFIFGNADYKQAINKHIAILYALELIDRRGDFYRSQSMRCFFEFGFDRIKVMSIFRNHYWRHGKERFSCI